MQEYRWGKRKLSEISDDDDDQLSENNDEVPQKKKRENKSWWDNSKIYSIDNHIYFYSSVNKDNIYRLNDLIIKINNDVKKVMRSNSMVKMEPKPIYLHINSFGGGVFAAFAAIDFITNSEIPIHTIIEGASASAATLMSVVGKKRYMTKHASMLIHQLSSWTGGKMNEIEDEYKNLEEMMENISKIYLDNTNLKKKELKDFLKHDRWWDFDKCKKHGLIDEEWNNQDID